MKGIHADQHALVQTTTGGPSAATEGPLAFKAVHNDLQWCGISSGGGRVHTDVPSGTPVSYSGLTPCDARFGTFSGSGALSVSPDRVARAAFDSSTNRLILDTPITVSYQGSVTFTAPSTGAFDVRFTMDILRDDRDFPGQPECTMQKGTPQLRPGESATYPISLSCQVKSLSSYTSNGYSAGHYALPTIVNLDFRSELTGGRTDPFYVFADPVFQLAPPTVLYAGNDGGVWSSTDAGASWADHNTNLAITQFFKGSLHPTNPEAALGGSQDNGVEAWAGTRRWKGIAGGDGGDSIYATRTPLHQAVAIWGNRLIQTSLDGGATRFEDAIDGLGADRDNLPFALRLAKCPTNDDVFLTGTRTVYRVDDLFSGIDPQWRANGPATPFQRAVTAFGFPPSSPNCNTYVAAAGPEILRTTDGGTSWISIRGTLPDKVINDVVFHPTNPSVLWVAFAGFDAGAAPGHLFRTDNALAAMPVWIDVTPRINGARLDLPHNAVLLDPVNPGAVYVGTDLGVLRSVDNGASFTKMGPDTGMPNVPVYDLKTGPPGTVLAYTHGRGAFRLVTRTADLAITKASDPATVAVGREIRYDITVRNAGPDAAPSVTVTDVLPGGVTFVSAVAFPGTCEGTGPVICRIGELANGATARVTIVVTATRAGTLTNEATVSAGASDPNPGNSQAFATTVVTESAAGADLSITKSHSPQPVTTGSRITYTLRVSNNGPGDATGVSVADTLPSGVTFVSATASQGSCSGGGALVCGLGSLAGGASATITIVATARGSGTLTNTATVTGAETDPNPGNGTATDVATVGAGPVPVIRVTPASVDFGTVTAKQTAQRTLVIQNLGTGSLRVKALGTNGGPVQILSPTAPFDVPLSGQQTVTLLFSPQSAGNTSRLLVISSNDPVHPSVVVPLTGIATAVLAPRLELTPAALNLGLVGVGGTRSVPVRMKNTGNATLNVSAVTSDSSRFTTTLGLPATLAAGAEQTFNVTFSPQTRGVLAGRLQITSNDSDSPSTGFQLRGEGAEAAATTEVLSTDDGSVESGTYANGLVVVNRLTPTRYPATLTRISVFFVPFQNFPSPSGAPIRLVAYADPTGVPASPRAVQLLLNQPATIPNVPGQGVTFDYDLVNGPTITSGDLYVGYAAPNPAGGVIFSADTNGAQRQRGYFSTDNGATFQGPLVIQNPSGAPIPANIMIRATVASGGSTGGSSCTWGTAPAKIDVPREGGSGAIAVSAPAGCAWTVTSSSPFLTFAAGRVPLVGGVGNGTVSFTAAPYTGDTPRTALVNIAELDTSVGQSSVSTGTASFASNGFVPVVLSTGGVNGSFFTSELTLTNRGSTSAVLEARYTPAFGGGGGTGTDVLAPGSQRVYPDGLAYLASIGATIPETGNRGGTVAIAWSGLSSPSAGSATVRTTSSVPEGRAGLAYSAVPSSPATAATVYVTGLRQNASDRSNLAMMNTGSSGDVVLRPTVFSGDPASPIAATLPDVGLAPGGFSQLSGVLASNGLAVTNGYVKVERVAGTAPFYAYGVINDQANSDGSFVPPVSEEALVGRSGLTLPVVVETSTFLSELVATNFGGARKTLRFTLVADALTAGGGTATFSLDLAPRQQTVIPNLVQYLRERGAPGVPAAGATVVGPVFASVDSGDASGLFVGARTSSAGGGGRYGLFYTGVPRGTAANQSAWLFGLQQDAENRTNVALVNTGETDSSTDVFRLDLYDGETGALVRTIDGIALAARKLTQLNAILATYAPGVANGYAKVTRTSGNNPFIAYAVVNDGGQAGQRTGDGAFIAMTSVDE
ncbi:MAG: DUF11 domain-containing protein [Acidobacteria bacterium]|nr:DUF11 domain-containing protein [Acidobacteriota bacterium]